ncbi:hypothetical protein BC936DRAFT_141352 [Jimgerdemannia flammicorona]|uniref:START domain-containing protein n=1 Tax=Jimgerdemannia flammicorona TaxID=994334 RepID=A0A433DG46_9FUNG|nr:hypothetical protein BC936DRAFT_141352 [Jimgerdemannia flammicorona]
MRIGWLFGDFGTIGAFLEPQEPRGNHWAPARRNHWSRVAAYPSFRPLPHAAMTPFLIDYVNKFTPNQCHVARQHPSTMKINSPTKTKHSSSLSPPPTALAMPFPASQFTEFLTQFTTQDFQGWAFYAETSQFKVYRRLSARNPSLYEYRCVGGFPDVPANILSHVYLDLEYRRSWDKNMISYTLLRPDTYHYLIKYPWPLHNRDYIYEIVRRRVALPGAADGAELAYVIIGDSVLDIQKPPEKGVTRIDNYLQKIVILASEDGKGSRVLLDYFDDPKVYIR